MSTGANNRHRAIRIVAGLVFALVVASGDGARAAGETFGRALTAGTEAFDAGRVAEAVDHWTRAVEAAQDEGNDTGLVEALLRRAEALRSLGHLFRAADDLEACRSVASQIGDSTSLALASGTLGAVYLSAGRIDEAEPLLREGGDALARHRQAAAAAATLHNLGLAAIARQDYDAARGWLVRSRGLAQDSDEPAIAATAAISAARLALTTGNLDQVEGHLAGVDASIATLPAGAMKVRLLLARAVTLLRLQETEGHTVPARVAAIYKDLRTAADLAGTARDSRGLSYALGYLGRLYEFEGRAEDALRLTREATNHALCVADPAVLYQWHWQTGRLLAGLGQRDAAVEAYRRAATILTTIRPDVLAASDSMGVSFRSLIGPVYQEYADLLLARAKGSADTDAAQADLRAARGIIESLKAVELEDYFNDACVAALRAKTSGIDVVEPGTAALYPILLQDRTELILTIGGTLKLVTVPVGVEQLTEQVRLFRARLERLTTRRYIRHARVLYDWLIRPIEADLEAAEIANVVFVPDGPLRTIPLGALHDGKRFVVEKFAVSVTPGLTLLEPTPLEREQVNLLIGGLTVAVQGYPALPFVDREITEIGETFPTRVLKNAEFLAESVRDELARQPYSVVHIASHGEFGSAAKDSYLLTYDGKMTLDRLESFVKLSRFREEPLELLTLSACRTAAGDDRAALGLAGIAIKSGARSALASLWFISDEASSRLVAEFYRQFRVDGTTKTEALRQAQLSMLSDRRFRHAGYWSPFLLIGNWL